MSQLFTTHYHAVTDIFWFVGVKKNFWKHLQEKENIQTLTKNEILCTALL